MYNKHIYHLLHWKSEQIKLLTPVDFFAFFLTNAWSKRYMVRTKDRKRRVAAQEEQHRYTFQFTANQQIYFSN